jgi:hypothetical protein
VQIRRHILNSAKDTEFKIKIIKKKFEERLKLFKSQIFTLKSFRQTPESSTTETADARLLPPDR